MRWHYTWLDIKPVLPGLGEIIMAFDIEKCAMLVMKKEKIVKSVGIELLDSKVIKLLEEGESYKYLGILEADKFLEEKMK